MNFIIKIPRKTPEHRGNNKPLLLSSSSLFHNNNETNTSSIWNLAHYSNGVAVDHRDHLSSAPTLLAVTIFVGFTLAGLLLLWRRYRYANRFIWFCYRSIIGIIHTWDSYIHGIQRGDLPLYYIEPRSHSFSE